jgi:hypothetical protein
MPMFDSSLDFALKWLAAHPQSHLFPILRYQKQPPLIKNNLDGASNDPEQIKKWHAKNPGCNWGLALKKSGFIVVDVDRKDGKVGEETFDDLDMIYGFPPTLKVRSPSGGWHLYYNATAEVPHQYAQGKHGFGPDVDSTNYVMLPGCFVSEPGSVGDYEIIEESPIVDAPAWFGNFLKRPTPVEARDIPVVELDQQGSIDWAVRYLTNDAPPSIEGKGGEKTLLDVAAVLKDRGISEQMAVELLDKHYNVPGKCEPMWEVGEGPPQDRLDVKVHNAWVYLNENAPGSDTPEAEFSGDPLDDAAVDKIVAAWSARDTKVKAVATQAKSDIDEVCKAWVYIAGMKRFVRRDDPDFRNYVWDVEAFDNNFMHLRGRYTKFSKRLLENRLIRKFATMGYKPGEDEFCGDIYNLYRPGSIVPQPGDTTLWDEHLNYLFQDPTDRDHVLNWIAWLLQHIGEKPRHALLIAGYQTGTGKSFIGEVVTQLLGPHNVAPIGEDELDSTFNEWALKSKLLLVEELQALDRGAVKKKLHPLITQESIIINDKNVKRYKVNNCFGIMAMSNEDAAINIGQNDRRYLVVRTHAAPKDKTHYERLYGILRDPAALGAIYHQLLTRDLTEYSGKDRAPYTAAKGEMIEAGMTDLEHHIVEHSGIWPFNARVVTMEDVISSLPTRLQTQPRVRQNLLSILTHRIGVRRLGQQRISKTERVYFYALGKSGVGNIAGTNVLKIWQEDKAAAGNAAVSSAASDFEEVSGE